MIRFNKIASIPSELEYMSDVINNSTIICGDGKYTKLCSKWIESNFITEKVLLTTSGTHALEMAAILCDIQPGDEVIMPSYTFVSTANAFILRGAKIKFVDIRPDTLNIDETRIVDAITKKTKAIVPVHYAGVSCEMNEILMIAKNYNICVIEDAAQGVMAKYNGKFLGTMGSFGCYSFHETKNYTMGEGGAILINDKSLQERAEIIREKGTNRTRFFRGEIDKYTWVDIGSSYLPSDINAAFLYAQLEVAKEINENRLQTWNIYYNGLEQLYAKGYVELPYIPMECEHNAHMFYIKVKNLEERIALMNYLRQREIQTVFHYVPLHSSTVGSQFGEFIGDDNFTTKESERIIRLPIYYNIDKSQIDYVIDGIYTFYNCKY